jgi:hypothetical protein
MRLRTSPFVEEKAHDITIDAMLVPATAAGT